MQPVPAFTRVLVPYDGSEPAKASLHLALPIAQAGAHLTVMTVADEKAIIAESLSAMTSFDAAPMVEALEKRAKALLAEARATCDAAGVTPELEIVHDTPVEAILARANSKGFNFVIMGTHARQGVARTFLGSTTEGVLRRSEVPVLTVRTAHASGASLFSTVIVAIDESESDVAVALAARLSQTQRARIVACHVSEPGGSQDQARAIVLAAFARAGLAPATETDIETGEPAAGVRAATKKHAATLIIAGTHGRRGVHRLLLGSVAEELVRTSPVPVLVAR